MTRELPPANEFAEDLRLKALDNASNDDFDGAFGTLESAQKFLAEGTPDETPAILRIVQAATIDRTSSLISMHRALQPEPDVHPALSANNAATSVNRALLRTAKFVAATEAAAVPGMQPREVHSAVCIVHARALVASALVRVGKAAVTTEAVDDNFCRTEIVAARKFLGGDDPEFSILALQVGTAAYAWINQKVEYISIPEQAPAGQQPEGYNEQLLAHAIIRGIRARIG